MKVGTLCYIRRDGRTLMMLRTKVPGDPHWGRWNGLGGKMEPGETPEACVKREVLEESGLVLEDPRLRGILTFPAFEGDDAWYVFLFEAFSFSGELRECREGFLEWVDDSAIPTLNLWEGDHLFLSWMAEGRFFSGRLAYESGGLVGHEVVFYPLEVRS